MVQWETSGHEVLKLTSQRRCDRLVVGPAADNAWQCMVRLRA